MAPRKAQAQPEPQTDQAGHLQIEDPDPRIRIVMAKWGVGTEAAIEELSLFAPGWAAWLRSIYTMVDEIMAAPVGQ